MLIIINKTKDGPVDVKRIGDKIIAAKVVLGEETMNTVSAYAPQIRLGEEMQNKILRGFKQVGTRNT